MADLFTDASSFNNRAIDASQEKPYLRDYQHASKLFVADQYRLMPKLGNLFYVYFDLNPSAAFSDPENPNKDKEIGLLVKSVSLPKFSVDVKKYNAYNRPNYNQTKISYDTVSINFHDDSSNVVRNFWFDYYHYHFRDSDYNESLYGIEHKYAPQRPSDKWGYSIRNNNTRNYLNAIRIYSLHQKKFSLYILINPVIKSFRHGEHSIERAEIMSHEMQVEYETVLYCYGDVGEETIPGFMDLHYDKTPSPLSLANGGPSAHLGPNSGLTPKDPTSIENLAEKRYGSAINNPKKQFQPGANLDPRKATFGELREIGRNIRTTNNPTTRVFFPSLSTAIVKIPEINSAFRITGNRKGVNVTGSLGGLVSVNAGPGGRRRFALAPIIPVLMRRSTEMNNRTSLADGYPRTPSTGFPSLNGLSNLIPGRNTSNEIAGPPTINNSGENLTTTDQGGINPQTQTQESNRNISLFQNLQKKVSLDISTLRDRKVSGEQNITTYTEKYNESVAEYGENSQVARSYKRAIENEQSNQEMYDQDISRLNDKLTDINNDINFEQSTIDGLL